ncbi:PREDICTED: rho guanine nucleotide exchange factor 10 [Gekko japonicus]|uniref:Rho guanine nucleotide exchange factor 10 n=1 Tax=Gekko japonicus TaxID=146911 RepID=A0ABM1JQQ1_GEKJA|nr:PREDICTED: rho guanine nucleotide exchange factor 10 [Gekko japonicus]
MDMEGFPPPPPTEVLENELTASATNEEEEEGEQFDFDSGDEIPEADRQTILPSIYGSRINADQEQLNSSGIVENVAGTEKMQRAEANSEGALPRVNPYSVITISPVEEKEPSLSPEPSPQDGSISPSLSGGYSVPVPCGYAVPSNIPLILPAYSSPVIIRSISLDEEANVQAVAEDCHSNSQSSEDPQNSEDNQGNKDDNTLVNPPKTEWMESK